MVNSVIHALFHGQRPDSHTLIMSLNGPRPRLKGVKLALRIAGGGILMAAPVIQRLRYMVNLSGLLRAAENEVVILGSVKLF